MRVEQSNVPMQFVGTYVTEVHLEKIDAFAEAQEITRSMAIRVLLAMAIMEIGK